MADGKIGGRGDGVKYPDDSSLETGCRGALRQIEDKGYETRLKHDGMDVILKYGVNSYRILL